MNTQINIFYSSIIHKETKVLTDCTEYYGNIQQTALKIAKTIKKKNHKGSLSFDNSYTFHYLDEDNITYLCLTDKSYPIEVAHLYLKQLKELLFNYFSIEQIQNTDNYGLDQVLKQKIRQKQNFFSQDKDSLNQIKIELARNISNTTNNNIYDTLETKTSSLNEKLASSLFPTNRDDTFILCNLLNESKENRHKMRIKKAKNIFVVFFILLFIGSLLCLTICGKSLEHCQSY